MENPFITRAFFSLNTLIPIVRVDLTACNAATSIDLPPLVVSLLLATSPLDKRGGTHIIAQKETSHVKNVYIDNRASLFCNACASLVGSPSPKKTSHS